MISGAEDMPTVIVSYPHVDLHTPGWMGQLEMALKWLMGGGGRFQWLDSLPTENH